MHLLRVCSKNLFIKLIINTLLRNEERLQTILQIVERDRKVVPNQRKVEARRKKWFLQI